jgi:hypothetical protein
MREQHPRDVAMAAIRAVKIEGWVSPHDPQEMQWARYLCRVPQTGRVDMITIAALGRGLAGAIDIVCGPVSIRCRPSEVQAAVTHAVAWVDRKGGVDA